MVYPGFHGIISKHFKISLAFLLGGVGQGGQGRDSGILDLIGDLRPLRGTQTQLANAPQHSLMDSLGAQEEPEGW